MNNSHGILHKVVIAIGLFLGVTATGMGAKANTHQPVTTNHNNQQTNHINQSSIQNNKTTLINQQSDINNKINNLKQQPKVQTDNGQINNGQNNNAQEQSKQSVRDIHNQTQQLYNRIVSSGINRSTYRNSNSNNNDSKLYQVKSRQYSMGTIRAHRIHHYIYNRNNTTILRYMHRRNSGHNYYHGN